MFKLRKKDFLQVSDLTADEVFHLFELAKDLKNRHKRGELRVPILKGKVLGMVFAKPSTRTRTSFEVAMLQLDGHAINLSAEGTQISRGETTADTGRALSRYLNGIMIRTFKQTDTEELAKHSDIPVINGLTDLHHPCQALADFYTIWEKRSGLKEAKLAYFGDGNNVCHSLMQTADLLGVEMLVVTPKDYQPRKEVLSKLKNSHQKINVTTDPKVSLSNVDFIYTDTWVSMGQEETKKEKKIFLPYQVNSNLLKNAAAKVMVMHCLPAHRGEEITEEVIDGPNSIVWDQAENRLHLQKALLAALL
ncbi:MAG: ornithine carbamoyltransferase [Candidatus Ratteibacteria bacterium]|jgi:ornithine carbamoyltransferase